jgi:alkanesulfonate monooxygenase SsuD/methylene tetrahydromethanopterin reductase-like flavin-dependent oxidoreductase (luciferase family)
VILSANVAVAETTQAARDVLMPEAWAMAQSRTQGQFPPLEPTKSIQEQAMTPRQRNLINEALVAAIYGTANDVAEELSVLLEVLKADELMVTTNTFDTATLAETDGRLAALFGLG